jgi:hypothetical protein
MTDLEIEEKLLLASKGDGIAVLDKAVAHSTQPMV